MSKYVSTYLIYTASTGKFRTRSTTRSLELDDDEMAWRIWLELPDGWGRLRGQIELEAPSEPVVEPVVEPA